MSIYRQAKKPGRSFYLTEEGKETPYQLTVKRLYAFPILKERILDNEEQLMELETLGLDALRYHDGSVVRMLRPGMRIDPEEAHNAQMAYLRGRIATDEMEVKQVQRARLTEYVKARPNAQYHEGKGVWSVKCDIALPCATENELHLADAEMLVQNGCIAVCEGANMPTTLDATKYLQEHGVYFVPGKAANAGGVAVSGLEMTQNSERLSWTFEEVDSKLQTIMVNIFRKLDEAAKEYDMEGNYVAGANIAGFKKVADAMLAQGAI